MSEEKKETKKTETKILKMPKKVGIRQQVKNQGPTIQSLVEQIGKMKAYIKSKTKFTCEVDCPECDGKGQTTKKDGLKLDFISCKVCKGESRLYFQGIGEFFVKSEFENKLAEDKAAAKEAEARAALADQNKGKGEDPEADPMDKYMKPEPPELKIHDNREKKE